LDFERLGLTAVPMVGYSCDWTYTNYLNGSVVSTKALEANSATV
jgi:hypothetical protein